MTKRSVSSPSTSPSKRAKTSGQARLDSFFSPSKNPRAATTSNDLTHAEVSASSGVHVNHEAPSHQARSEHLIDIIDVDAMEETEKTPGSSQMTSQHALPPLSTEDRFPPAGRSSNANPKPSTPNATFIGITKEKADVTSVGYADLAVDPLSVNLESRPWQSKYAPYSFLSHLLETLAKTQSRIKIINTLTNGLRALALYDSSSLVPSLYLLSNSLSPPYIPIELGIGPSTISKAILHVSGGLSASALRALYIKTGDMGDAAFEAKSRVSTLVPHRALSVRDVYDILLKIASTKGPGAAKQKQQLVEKLLLSARGEETRFLVRTLTMNLRVGAVKTSILTALARALVLIPPLNAAFSIPAESRYHVTPEVLSQATALEPTISKKGKAVDNARSEVITRFTQAEHLLKRVFVQHPNYETILQKGLKQGGLDGLETRVPLTVGIPLHPTLGTPTRSLAEMYERVSDAAFTAEFKYDGQRAQIHGIRDESGKVSVSIFSRHLEDMTSKYPDIIALVQQQFQGSDGLRSFIMDSEIVAIHPETGEIQSFQELSNRARKDVQLNSIQVTVAVFSFDLMYLDGESLLKTPFRARRGLLRARFPPVTLPEMGSARFGHVENCDSADSPDAVENFWAKALESRCEGLMIKILDNKLAMSSDPTKPRRKLVASAHYEADVRTSSWLKLKKDYVDGLGDSLDLVPIGAWHGNGRKAKFWSPVLLGLRDSRTSKLYAFCKCMSGFTDVFYQQLNERYPSNEESAENCSSQPLWGGEFGGLRPSVYFRPQEVWEIRGADITISPVAPAGAGLVSDTRGLSLRFPRFIRLRNDKHVEDASDTTLLESLWKKQQGRPESGGADEGDLLDVELDEGGDISEYSGEE